MSFYKTKEWETLRKVVLKRDHWTCQVCGCGVRGKKAGQSRPVVDHIEPRPLGVNQITSHDVVGNLLLMCIRCHNTKTFGASKTEVGLDGLPVDGDWA